MAAPSKIPYFYADRAPFGFGLGAKSIVSAVRSLALILSTVVNWVSYAHNTVTLNFMLGFAFRASTLTLPCILRSLP